MITLLLHLLRLLPFLVAGHRQLALVLVRYFAYYHRARTHLALDKDAPDIRPVQLPDAGRIVEIPGGWI